MAAESIWRVRPAAKKFEHFPKLAIPAIQHPLEETDSENKLAKFWTRWETKNKKPAKTEDKEKDSYDFEDPLGATYGAADTQENVDRVILHDTTKSSRSFSLDNTLENRKSDRSTFDIELPDFQP